MPPHAEVTHAVVDWGTSSFRLWTLNREGTVLGERRSEEGLTRVDAGGFEAVLEDHLAALGAPAGLPVMMCGMVGARAGWVEAPYLDVPTRLEHIVAHAVTVPTRGRAVRILPGLAQRDSSHPDVMRGEETQLLALAREGDARLACLPGTHSKWVALEAGAVTGFATFMTGELFQLLRSQSVLAAALATAAPVDAASPAFAQGVTDAIESSESLSNRTFEIRAGWLLAGTMAEDALARLSGLLIGLELAGARARFGTLNGAALVAAGPAAALYRHALALAGAGRITVHDAETCVREGLHAAACRAFSPLMGADR